MFLLVNGNAASEAAAAILESAKHDLKEKILLCKTEIDAGMGERLGEYLNVSPSDLPLVLILDFKGDDMDKYYHNGEISESSINLFIDNYKSKLIKPTLLSEESV